eukprot:SAG31_NODE_30011_length_386_cov_1.243902_1_plen_44_part_01
MVGLVLILKGITPVIALRGTQDTTVNRQTSLTCATTTQPCLGHH